MKRTLLNDMKTAEDRLRKSNENDWAYLPVVFGVGAAVAALLITLYGPNQFVEDVAEFVYQVMGNR